MTVTPEPAVYSMRKGCPPVPSGAIYVGRPSPYGNPFRAGQDGTRTQVVAMYREWVYRDDVVGEAFRAYVRRTLRGRDLVCWCAPLPCHADVLLEVANESVPFGITQG